MGFIDTSIITGYQDKQRRVKEEAEKREEQAEKIRMNKESTLSFSDEQIRINSANEINGLDILHGENHPDPVFRKLARTRDYMSRRPPTSWQKFGRDMYNFAPRLAEKVRDLMYNIIDRKMDKKTYTYLRYTPRIELIGEWIDEFRSERKSWNLERAS